MSSWSQEEEEVRRGEKGRRRRLSRLLLWSFARDRDLLVLILLVGQMTRTPVSAKRSASAKKGWDTRRRNAKVKEAKLRDQANGHLTKTAVRQSGSEKDDVDCDDVVKGINTTEEFIQLIANGDSHAVTAILTSENYGNIDMNAVNKSGTSPLIRAVKSRNCELVEQLIDIPHLDVNIEDKLHRSALVWAVHRGNIDMMKILLNRSDVQVNNALTVAASYGYQEIVSLLLDECDNVDINAVDNDGNTALICAIKNYEDGSDMVGVVDLLLKREDLDVTKVNNYGESSLIQAVRARNYDLVNSILSHKSCNNAEFIEHKDNHGVSAFIWALHCDCLDIANLIVEKAEENYSPRRIPYSYAAVAYGTTALTIAMVHLLWSQYIQLELEDDSIEAIKYESDQRYLTGVLSWNFLKCDSIFNKYIVRQLLSRDDLCVNKLDEIGHSALTWSMSNAYDTIVNMLLDRNDVMINRLDMNGETPLVLACRIGRHDYVELLVERDDLIVNAPDSSGITAIQWALSGRNLDIIGILLERVDLELDVEGVLEKAIDEKDDEIIIVLLENIPLTKKCRRDFFEKLNKYKIRMETTGSGTGCDFALKMSLLFRKHIRAIEAEVHAGVGEKCDPFEEVEEASSKITLYLTIFVFIFINYALNVAYQTYNTA